MRLTFLGTSSGTPTRYRNVSAIGLQFLQQGAMWLLDCGEATQHQFLRSPLKLSQLERIFITHLHGDHIYGLPGLLASRALQYGATTPLTIYGPAGLEAYLQATLGANEGGSGNLGYPLNIVTVKPGILYEDENLQVTCAPLEHRVPAFGYALTEKPQAGRFDAEAAARLGIAAGPIYGRLKAGQTVTLPDGREIDGKTLVGPTRPGRKLVYCTDTIYSRSSIALAEGADVLIHEATYADIDRELARRGGHSTARQAAQVALEAGVKNLIITHFSARYDAKEGLTVEDLLKEAQMVFPNTQAASDFWSYDLPRKEFSSF